MDPDPDLDPDPDPTIFDGFSYSPGGPKTCGSGSGTLAGAVYKMYAVINVVLLVHWEAIN